jgi:class 3 adenylate cyclase
VPQAGVFFCDLAGFTAYSSTTEPERVVEMLQETFSLLEQKCVEHKVEKIKTIGDAFMAVSGVSVPVDNPGLAIAEFALAVGELLDEHLAEKKLNLGFRIGIHVGPVLAGVIGSDRLFFDVWGDTVNFASRLESSGQNGDVRCSSAIREMIGEDWGYRDCGRIELKGKGEQQVWALQGRSGESLE